MTWQLEHHRALISWPCGTAVSNASDLRTGWRFINGPQQGVMFAALPNIAPAPAGAEHDLYVRGSDLIITRGACEADPFRVQVYARLWSDMPAGIDGGCELVLSIQTPHWETSPELQMVSVVPAVLDSVQRADQLLLHTTAGTMCCLTHPLDYIEQRIIRTCGDGVNQAGIEAPALPAAGPVRVEQRLFAQRLEKGVILRCRMWFGWGNSNATDRDWQACRERFLQSPPMLTA